MKRMISTGPLLDAVGYTQSIIVFAHNTVITEVKPRTELTLCKAKYM